MNTSTIVDFFATNWYNILTLLFSLVALIVAIQANIFARKTSAPNISIKDVYEIGGRKSVTNWHLNTRGCYKKITRSYDLTFEVVGEFWITNGGGMASTLVNVGFDSDFDRVLDNRFDIKWNVKMSEHTNPYTGGGEIFDLNIPSGTTVPIDVDASSYSVSFPTKETALSFVDKIRMEFASSGVACRWYFRFGDGTTYIRSFKNIVFLKEIGSLEKDLDSPCEKQLFD